MPVPQSGSDLAIDPQTLTFTSTDWKTAKTITVTAGADDDPEDDHDAVAHTATGGGYGAVAVSSVQVSVADDDVAGVVFSTTSLGVVENGSATYTVRLGGVPRDTVTVAPGVPEDAKVSVDPSELVFTVEDWETLQTVTVTAADDDDTANEDVAVSHVATGGNYDGEPVPDVRVTVTDDDTAGVTLSVDGSNGGRGRRIDLHGAAGHRTRRDRDVDARAHRRGQCRGEPRGTRVHADELAGGTDRHGCGTSMTTTPPTAKPPMSHTVAGGGYDDRERRERARDGPRRRHGGSDTCRSPG